LEDKDVLFAGYRLPHPLKPMIQVKIQTTNSTTPLDVMRKSLGDLVGECATLEARVNVRDDTSIELDVLRERERERERGLIKQPLSY
jgi:DNA-directed RNA polymerase subunit L